MSGLSSALKEFTLGLQQKQDAFTSVALGKKPHGY